MPEAQTLSATPTWDVFHAVADPTRRQLLDLLSLGETAVMPLCAPFDISRTAVSKHLHVLLAAGLVRERRAGRETLYSLDPSPLSALNSWLSTHETADARKRQSPPQAREFTQHMAVLYAPQNRPAVNWGED